MKDESKVVEIGLRLSVPPRKAYALRWDSNPHRVLLDNLSLSALYGPGETRTHDLHLVRVLPWPLGYGPENAGGAVLPGLSTLYDRLSSSPGATPPPSMLDGSCRNRTYLSPFPRGVFPISARVSGDWFLGDPPAALNSSSPIPEKDTKDPEKMDPVGVEPTTDCLPGSLAPTVHASP